MPTVSLNGSGTDEVIYRHKNRHMFVVLGPEAISTLPADVDSENARKAKRVNDKIAGSTRRRVEEIWGTLGLANDAPLRWKGRIAFSARGNERSVPEESSSATCREVELLRKVVPESREGERRVAERYINLSQLTFPDFPERFDYDAIPELRLTLMLAPNEGAVVFYQHGPGASSPASGVSDGETDIEYILPQPTSGNSCSNRDRLSYLIPILPERKLAEDRGNRLKLTKQRAMDGFVIKILIFKRDNRGGSSGVVGRAFEHIRDGKGTHELLRWEPLEGRFVVADKTAIHPNRKTLFLIHGTVSSTEVAFRHLCDGGTGSWLQERLNTGDYEQIIGFDHPTFSEDAGDNVSALIDRLPKRFSFKEPLDVLTHSRGGLVAKYLALYEPKRFPIRRGALAACANGVGYFTAGRWVSKGLAAFRAVNRLSPASTLGAILALAQHSGDYILNRPGSLLMTPEHPKLKEVLRKPKLSPVFLPLVGAYNPGDSENGLLLRWAARGLDLVIKPILGRDHDWVVGTKEQYILPDECYPEALQSQRYSRQYVLPARHSDYFNLERNSGLHRTKRFLRQGNI